MVANKIDRMPALQSDLGPADCPRVLVLCTLETGLDAVAEVIRRGFGIAGLVGLAPERADLELISGYIDIRGFCERVGVAWTHVRSYNLHDTDDRLAIGGLAFDLVWVAGWQRLVPEWLIQQSRLGVLGTHGSPDGIHGGRGRSPQNWALMLGCERFDLALFRITPGIDDGPIVAQRSFFYGPNDDIRMSYYRASLVTADMVCEVLAAPHRLACGVEQPATEAAYFPQRTPADGFVDWAQPRAAVCRHVRALSRPYPGLRSRGPDGSLLILWQCEPFDDVVEGSCGSIGACFEDGGFLVSCGDGRVLVRDWTIAADSPWRPSPGDRLESLPLSTQLRNLVDRHTARHPLQPVSRRILRLL